MTHMRAKLAVAALVLGLCVAYLATAGIRSGWVYYLDVDSFASAQKYQGQRVRLMGQVAEENVQVNSAQLSARFDLRGKVSVVPVQYAGIIPDTFKPGCDVVVEGQLEDGMFKADVLMTKCASKYEEDKGHGTQGRDQETRS